MTLRKFLAKLEEIDFDEFGNKQVCFFPQNGSLVKIEHVGGAYYCSGGKRRPEGVWFRSRWSRKKKQCLVNIAKDEQLGVVKDGEKQCKS